MTFLNPPERLAAGRRDAAALELGALPFVLTPSERTQAAIAAAHLEQYRREQNKRDNARALAGVLWMGEAA